MGLAPYSLAVPSAPPKLFFSLASGSHGPEGNKRGHKSLDIGQGWWRWGVWQRSPPCQKEASCRRTRKFQSVPGGTQSPRKGLVPPKGVGTAATEQVSHTAPVRGWEPADRKKQCQTLLESRHSRVPRKPRAKWLARGVPRSSRAEGPRGRQLLLAQV